MRGGRTGARDATNTAAVGEPDGKCLAKCDGWIYQQRAVVRVVRTEGSENQTAAATSTLPATELQPSQLLNASKLALTRATGLPFNEELDY